eukprot:m.254491 g.254491  ORF g.254491 m.254491 type:complete len:618 (-) comp18979_c0_seq1:333-2186(-)
MAAALENPTARARGYVSRPSPANMALLLSAAARGDTAGFATALAQSGLCRDALHELADAEGRTAVHLACLHGWTDLVAVLIDRHGFPVDQPDRDPQRRALPVHYAAWGGHLDLVMLLKAKSPHKHERDAAGNTAFLYAVYGGHLVCSRVLLHECGFSLRDRNDKGHSAIIQAACGGHRHVMQWLLSQGATLEERDDVGNTPLLFAAWSGHLELVQWLLLHGAALAETSSTGHNALLSAANSGQLRVCQWLVEACNMSVHHTNTNGDSPLLLAAFGGHTALIEYLARAGAALDARNRDGLDAVLSACNGGHKDTVDALLRLGCSLDVCNTDGYTPVILAACGGHLDLLQWLVTVHGCSTTARTKDGDSALLLACYCGHIDAVTWLLQAGMSITERNRAGLTPLLSAANGGHADVVELLLAYGASVHETDNEGFTGALLAVFRDHLDVFLTFVLHGATLDTVTSCGLSIENLSDLSGHHTATPWLPLLSELPPLHVAALLQSERQVRRLLFAGHDPRTPAASAAGIVLPIHLASRPLSLPGARPVNPTIVALLQAASLPWQPFTHNLFGPRARNQAVLAIMLWKRLAESGTLPYIPYEIWLHIISFLGRSDDVPRMLTV